MSLIIWVSPSLKNPPTAGGLQSAVPFRFGLTSALLLNVLMALYVPSGSGVLFYPLLDLRQFLSALACALTGSPWHGPLGGPAGQLAPARHVPLLSPVSIGSSPISRLSSGSLTFSSFWAHHSLKRGQLIRSLDLLKFQFISPLGLSKYTSSHQQSDPYPVAFF